MKRGLEMERNTPIHNNKKLKRQLLAASETLHKNDPPYRRASNLDFLISLVVFVTLALAIRMFVFEPVLVSGDSMYPTLLDGERMFVEKLTYLAEPPQRGDIVICHYPFYDENCVKRVVGLPGETVSVHSGQIYIDGQPLDESQYWDGVIYADMNPQKVPEDHVFVVGDNRNYSTDSRERTVGPLPYTQILGKVHYVIWPVSHFRNVYTDVSPMEGVAYVPPNGLFLWSR